MGHPSNAEFLAAFVFGAVAGAAVFLHADRRGDRHPTGWACFVFLCPGIALIAYYFHVRAARRSTR